MVFVILPLSYSKLRVALFKYVSTIEEHFRLKDQPLLDFPNIQI